MQSISVTLKGKKRNLVCFNTAGNCTDRVSTSKGKQGAAHILRIEMIPESEPGRSQACHMSTFGMFTQVATSKLLGCLTLLSEPLRAPKPSAWP